MTVQSNKTYFEKLNQWGKEGIPFFFLIDFEQQKPVAFPLSELPADVFFEVPGRQHLPPKTKALPRQILFERDLVDDARYQTAFAKVMAHLKHGNTYLLNLTLPSTIKCNLSLQQIFEHSQSLFRLLYKDEFVCFSPEIFVRIKEGVISSYPMKGTIDAGIENAEQQLMESPKEIAEHNTIVDLIRNDLSMVATNVRVKQFRYIDHVKTHRGELLQASSEIIGQLNADYPSHIGRILSKLLPAGSVSGAPKQMTMEIIRSAEQYDRGYYTGIFGVFDGVNMESAVLIRYIEKQGDELIFKSGGGITALSKMQEEYQELCDKVYVPISRKH